MVFWEYPLLKDGPFARFYCGSPLASTLAGKADKMSPVHHIAISLSFIIQVLFIFFKKNQLRESQPMFPRRGTYLYQNLMREIMLTGLNNIYTVSGILVFTGSITIYLTVHYLIISTGNNHNEDQDELSIPGSILCLGGLLFGLNLLQFVKNPALR